MSILLKAERTATKTACRNNLFAGCFRFNLRHRAESSFHRACARHSDVVFLFVMRQNRQKYASCGVKLSIIRRQILSSPDRRRGFTSAKGSNPATNPKGRTRYCQANPSGEKRSDDPMIDCGALYVVLDVDGVQSEKRVVCKIKIN